ncbi:MAG: acyltransferase [Pseudomonadota bacterium]
MHHSVADRIQATGSRTSGFDFLRIGLACAVFVWHLQSTSYGPEFALQTWQSAIKSLPTAILPMFFALSGFLVAGSLERCRTVGYFLYLRAIRIFPALAVEVLLSALILGPLLTSFAVGAYFTDPLFWRYLLNSIGLISFELPGVFSDNPFPNMVNAQLWTVPWELECYIAISIIGALRIYDSKAVSWAMLAALTGAFLISWFQGDLPVRHVSGRALVGFFLCGVLFFRLRRAIPYDARLFWICLVVSVIATSQTGGGYLALLPLTYVTVYIGLLTPRVPMFLRLGDYSYGIFLYHFAIQQAVVALFPWATNIWLNGIVSFALTLICAILSWHIIEKPSLSTRTFGKRMEDRWVARTGRLRPVAGE